MHGKTLEYAGLIEYCLVAMMRQRLAYPNDAHLIPLPPAFLAPVFLPIRAMLQIFRWGELVLTERSGRFLARVDFG